MSKPTRLHIGGTQKREGWHILNIAPAPEVDFVGNCPDLGAVADGSLDEVYASHVIEHLPHGRDLQQTFNEINRVLKVGGRLSIAVPDFEVLAKLYFMENAQPNLKLGVINLLFGGQSNEYDFHCSAFDAALLEFYLTHFGFGEIRRVADFGLFEDASSFKYLGVPVSLNMVAEKVQSVVRDLP
jgi:predicted SAM-dependent methyltransferase